MRRRTLLIVSVILVIFAIQSCKQHAEEGLLSRYFHAVSLKDVTTMSTMALEPLAIDVEDWEITAVGEEKIEPAVLPDLSKKEEEFKKSLEAHVGPTLDAKDLLDIAKDELDMARTRAAKAAAQKKVDELQAKYDAEYEIHKELQKNYNDSKAGAAREEEISIFSLGAGQIPNIRDLMGTSHSKEVDVKVTTKSGETKNYKFYLKKYELRDESLNMTRRGRWVIVKFETT